MSHRNANDDGGDGAHMRRRPKPSSAQQEHLERAVDALSALETSPGAERPTWAVEALPGLGLSAGALRYAGVPQPLDLSDLVRRIEEACGHGVGSRWLPRDSVTRVVPILMYRPDEIAEFGRAVKQDPGSLPQIIASLEDREEKRLVAELTEVGQRLSALRSHVDSVRYCRRFAREDSQLAFLAHCEKELERDLASVRIEQTRKVRRALQFSAMRRGKD